MTTVPERIEALRVLMKNQQIDAYIVPTADYHGSEYVGEYFKEREYITGFTGSSGTAVITATEVNLWTDARYFLQAEEQLKGSGILLRRMEEEGVPTILQYLQEVLPENGCIGYDGRQIRYEYGLELKGLTKEGASSPFRVISTVDLVDLIWDKRPSMPAEPIWRLSESYSGESTALKLASLRKQMEKAGASLHILSSLYDIAWLLNLRGNDISYVPVFLSYLLVTNKTCTLYARPQSVSREISELLEKDGICVRDYDLFYDDLEDLKSLPTAERVMADPQNINDRLGFFLSEHCDFIKMTNPTLEARAIKNSVQIENLRKAHLKDGIAMCKFMCWLKSNIGKLPMSECSVSDRLEEFRKEQPHYIELSFETISGYNAHGAIVHYTATPKTDVPLKPCGLLLVDSGAHYLEGTTDVTRTFALGPLTEDMKKHFTLVLRSHIALARARFLKGCSGLNLDILAREPLWEAGLDYKHGTGHGVGYLLNVHEGPNAFRWKTSPSRSEHISLLPGMITTDEPGLYITNQYGIRTESELLCCEGEHNEYGQFMYFENLTYVPIDVDAIDSTLLSDKEIQWLNDYHQRVYDQIAPFLSEEESCTLRKYTAPITQEHIS